jgi:small subunit ribosomal protein S20
MPIIKSAKKQMRQSRVRQKRNNATRTRAKEAEKNTLNLVKEGNAEEASKSLQVAYKAIDTAAKKNIFHNNRAARKKSKLAHAVAGLQKK